jgi:hypothetical protein
MRFLMLTTTDPAIQMREPDEKLFAEMGEFVEELSKAGVLLATGGLEQGGVQIRSQGGEISMTDGPFPEAKEVVVSFALVDVRDRDEAIELARRFWQIVGDGVGEVRQVFGPEG